MRGITLSGFKIHAITCVAAFLTLPVWVVNAQSLGTVDIVRSGHGAGRSIDLYGGGLSGQQGHAGVYMLEKTASSGAGDIWANGSIGGFCIELEEPAPNATYTYDVVNTPDAYSGFLEEALGAGKADALSELWGRYHNSAWEGTGGFTSAQNNEAAAFATAVWEIVYEDLPDDVTDWDVSRDYTWGSFRFGSDQVDSTLANSWLHSLNGTGPKASLAVFTQDGNQNYVVAVPEPTTIALLGLGGIMSLARKRRHA